MPISLYKERGETPLQALDKLRLEKPEYAEANLSYAGRLDPMAEGAMLVLVGEENKERQKYLELDKEYEIEILFGFATDTYDTLGLITEQGSVENVSRDEIERVVMTYARTFMQPYPKYSSKSISNGFNENSSSPKEVTIYRIELQGWKEIQAENLLQGIIEDINKVSGNFRQDEIKSRWKEALTLETSRYPILALRVTCSSGTYMRSIADRLGREAEMYAHAYRIKRLRIGNITS